MTAGMTIAAAVALGVGYALAIWYIPFINLLSLAGAPMFGVLIATTADHGFRTGRVRHRGAALAVVVLASAIGLYVSWIVWIAAVQRTPEALDRQAGQRRLTLNSIVGGRGVEGPT